MEARPCSGCGLLVEDGATGCRRIFDGLIARDFSDVRYFRVHRLMVDTYCLQHPDEYCASAKSMAAHLTGVAWLLEREHGRGLGNESLRRWIESAPLARPDPPAVRGRLTIAHVRDASDPQAHAEAVERWARATWEAYAPLHAIAAEWMRAAFETKARPRR